MPGIDDAAIVLKENPVRGACWIGVLWPAAIIVAMPLWVGACAPVAEAPLPAATGASSPTIAEAPLGPIALAPNITGTPLPPPTPASAVAIPAPPSSMPVAAVALPPEPPPAPVAVETPAAAPSPCPPGATAVLSKPDMSGTPVLLCRRLPPTR
jgi:hypothetical protein